MALFGGREFGFGRRLGFGDSMRRIIAMGEGEPPPEERELEIQPVTPGVGATRPQPQRPTVADTGRPKPLSGLGFGNSLWPLQNFGMGAQERYRMRAQSLWAPRRVPATQRGDYSRGYARQQRGPRLPSTLRAA